MKDIEVIEIEPKISEFSFSERKISGKKPSRFEELLSRKRIKIEDVRPEVDMSSGKKRKK